VRPALVTLLLAVAVGAAVLGAGWLAQSAVLPAPARADMIAAAASTWLSRYRLVVSRFRIGSSGPVQATCLQGWFAEPDGTLAPGTLLRFGRTSILASDGRTTQVPRAPRAARSRLLVVRLALAGCPRFLARRVVALIQSGPRPPIERTVLSGRPVIALRIGTRGLRLRLYLQPLTYRPIAVSASDGGLMGVSEIRLTRLTPTLLRKVGLHP
jgi:hypothetical protein